jgi:hypothetical protein
MAWVLGEHAVDRLQRKNAGNSTTLEVSLDVFHTKQEAQRVLRKLWNRVESRWARAEEADRQVGRAWRNGGDRRGFGGVAGKAWKKVERAMERYDRVEQAWKRVETAFELFRPDGRLNDRTWAEGEIAAAVQELDGAEWGKLRRALTDHRSLTFLDRMQRQLAAAELRAEAVYWLPRWFRRSIAGGWQRTGRSRTGGWRRSCDKRSAPAVLWSA